MADDTPDNRINGADYPISEEVDPVRYRLAERATTFIMRPSSDAEADMLREIDATHERVRVGIPEIDREMAALFSRIGGQGTR